MPTRTSTLDNVDELAKILENAGNTYWRNRAEAAEALLYKALIEHRRRNVREWCHQIGCWCVAAEKKAPPPQ